jgi:mannose-6-phosphate isomerase-like protein (cupin superfamily)
MSTQIGLRETGMDIIHRDQVTALTTKDGSTIREILSPANSCTRRQSLAEATLAPGRETQAHYHPQTEEIYYILSGSGEMRIREESQEVGPGDGIIIPPGAAHQIRNIGEEDLVFLCCCVPAYTHEDTVMTTSLFPDTSSS